MIASHERRSGLWYRLTRDVTERAVGESRWFVCQWDGQRYVDERSMSWIITLFSGDFSVRFSYPRFYLFHLSLTVADKYLKYIII